MPVSATNPVAAIKMSDDDVILNLVRDRVIDRLVYDSLFSLESANWLVHHLITPELMIETRIKWKFPKPSGHLLDWLDNHSDGVQELVDHFVKKFLKFASPEVATTIKDAPSTEPKRATNASPD